MRQPVDRPKPTLQQRTLRVLLFCAALYLLACVGCASFQRRLIYFPPAYTSEQLNQLAQQAKLERWTAASGQPIGMKHRSPVQPAAGRVLIVYGNGSSTVGCAHYADVIQAVAAFDVFILEYPGYADRPGSPGQNHFFRAADEAFRSLPTNRPVYLVGESLGTGVAAYLAGTYPDKIDGVTLLAPYNRLTDVAQAHMPILPVRLILLDRYPSQDYLRNYHGPVAMLVGGRDQVIPEKFGRRLYDAYDGPKRLWKFPDGNHGTVMFQPPEIWRQIVNFWQISRPKDAGSDASEKR